MTIVEVVLSRAPVTVWSAAIAETVTDLFCMHDICLHVCFWAKGSRTVPLTTC